MIGAPGSSSWSLRGRHQAAGERQAADDHLEAERQHGHAAKVVAVGRTHALASQIVVGLYPAQLTTQATVDRTDEFLASLPEGSAALRRMMLENRDGVARALRARQADVG